MEKKDNPVYYLLSEWLRGANQEKDSRPVTWRTLIKALQQANVQEEVDILAKHFIQIPMIAPNAGELSIWSCVCLTISYLYTCANNNNSVVLVQTVSLAF